MRSRIARVVWFLMVAASATFFVLVTVAGLLSCGDSDGDQEHGQVDQVDAGSAESCQFAGDGVCDEGIACAAGTDTADCSGADSCVFAKDGECDEPAECPVGTDTTDCS